MSNTKLVSIVNESFDIKLDEGYDSSSWTGSSELYSNSSPGAEDCYDLGGFDAEYIWHEDKKDSISQGIKKPKKKRKKPYYIPVNKLPRILKRDIRRDYPNMYVNVLNSQDPELMNSFFEQFAIPTLSFSRYLPHAHRHNVPVSRSMNGIQTIAEGIHEEIKDFPDFVLQIQSVKIYQKEHMSGCKIIIQSLMKGTMMIYAETYAKAIFAAEEAAKKKLKIEGNNSNGNITSNHSKRRSGRKKSVPMPSSPLFPSVAMQHPAISNALELSNFSPSAFSNLAALFAMNLNVNKSFSEQIIPFLHNVVTQTTFSVDDEYKIYQIEVTDQFLPVEQPQPPPSSIAV